jgi:AcrR family transcriptional regulator
MPRASRSGPPAGAPGAGRRAQRRELTRAEIIDISTRMFVHDGYDATTLGAVAEAVGISVPTLLTHFPSKEHLVLAREYDILAAFERTVADPGRAGDTLTLWNQLVTTYVRGKAGPLDAFARRLRWVAGTPPVSRALLGLAQAYAEVLEAGFRADAGRLVHQHLAARLGVRLAATGLAFGHFALLTQWAAEGAPDDLLRRCDQLVAGISRQLPAAVLG